MQFWKHDIALESIGTCFYGLSVLIVSMYVRKYVSNLSIYINPVIYDLTRQLDQEILHIIYKIINHI